MLGRRPWRILKGFLRRRPPPADEYRTGQAIDQRWGWTGPVRACYPAGFGMVTGAPQLDSVMSTLPWSLSMTIRTRFAAGAGVEALVSTIHKVIGSLPHPYLAEARSDRSPRRRWSRTP